MDHPALEFRNVNKKFGSAQAVRDLSFTVSPGRITGFLGPNGAGKTTTLRILLGLVHADSGSALVGGSQYTSLKAPMRQVGAHLESGNVHPGRTGRAHLRIACAQGQLDPSRIDSVLALVGMQQAADRKMGGYSLGMLQRLGLATAMLGDPAALVLDEPANGLDPEGMRWLRGFLRTLAGQGRTIFLSSHLLGEIQQMADDVVIISRGRVVTSGSVHELESAQGAKVLVAATDTEALRMALGTARLRFTQSGPGSFEVHGVTSEVVGNTALAAGVPLTHLSQQTSGLEDLFMSAVGGGQ